MLSLYRRLIELRRNEPALAVGDYAALAAEGSVLAYRRRHAGRELLVALNLGAVPAALRLPAGAGSYAPLLTTRLDAGRPPEGDLLELQGDEGVILALT